MSARLPRVSIARAYAAPAPAGERRFLVDRVWPRGVKRDDLALDEWAKEAAPSDALRRWFGHAPERWDEFRARYLAELEERPEALAPLVDAARAGPVLLLFGAKDEQHNQAVVLREHLERLADPGG